jgi:hypothetical protein
MTEPMIGAYFTKCDHNAPCGSRVRWFEGQSVNVDVIAVRTPHEFAEACILRHISFSSIEVQETAEASARDVPMRTAAEVRT